MSSTILFLVAMIAMMMAFYLAAEISIMAKAQTLVEEALKKEQAAMNHYIDKAHVGVIVNVVTCWWSTWSMCNRLLHLKNALKAGTQWSYPTG
jgi:hypothetical protein